MAISTVRITEGLRPKVSPTLFTRLAMLSAKNIKFSTGVLDGITSGRINSRLAEMIALKILTMDLSAAPLSEAKLHEALGDIRAQGIDFDAMLSLEFRTELSLRGERLETYLKIHIDGGERIIATAEEVEAAVLTIEIEEDTDPGLQPSESTALVPFIEGVHPSEEKLLDGLGLPGGAVSRALARQGGRGGGVQLRDRVLESLINLRFSTKPEEIRSGLRVLPMVYEKAKPEEREKFLAFLEELFTKQQEPEVRTEIGQTLLAIGMEEAFITQLVRYSRGNENTRVAALFSLAEYAGKPVVPERYLPGRNISFEQKFIFTVFLEALKSEKSAAVVDAALDTLSILSAQLVGNVEFAEIGAKLEERFNAQPGRFDSRIEAVVRGQAAGDPARVIPQLEAAISAAGDIRYHTIMMRVLFDSYQEEEKKAGIIGRAVGFLETPLPDNFRSAVEGLVAFGGESGLAALLEAYRRIPAVSHLRALKLIDQLAVDPAVSPQTFGRAEDFILEKIEEGKTLGRAGLQEVLSMRTLHHSRFNGAKRERAYLAVLPEIYNYRDFGGVVDNIVADGERYFTRVVERAGKTKAGPEKNFLVGLAVKCAAKLTGRDQARDRLVGMVFRGALAIYLGGGQKELRQALADLLASPVLSEAEILGVWNARYQKYRVNKSEEDWEMLIAISASPNVPQEVIPILGRMFQGLAETSLKPGEIKTVISQEEDQGDAEAAIALLQGMASRYSVDDKGKMVDKVQQFELAIRGMTNLCQNHRVRDTNENFQYLRAQRQRVLDEKREDQAFLIEKAFAGLLAQNKLMVQSSRDQAFEIIAEVLAPRPGQPKGRQLSARERIVIFRFFAEGRNCECFMGVPPVLAAIVMGLSFHLRYPGWSAEEKNAAREFLTSIDRALGREGSARKGFLGRLTLASSRGGQQASAKEPLAAPDTLQGRIDDLLGKNQGGA